MLYSDDMVTFFIPLTISKCVLCNIANNLITIVIEKEKKDLTIPNLVEIIMNASASRE